MATTGPAEMMPASEDEPSFAIGTTSAAHAEATVAAQPPSCDERPHPPPRASVRATRTVGRSGAVRARFFPGHGMRAHGDVVRSAMRTTWDEMPMSSATPPIGPRSDRAFRMDNGLRGPRRRVPMPTAMPKRRVRFDV